MKDPILWILVAIVIGGLIWGEPARQDDYHHQPNWVAEERRLPLSRPPNEDDQLRGRVADDDRDGLPFSDARQGRMVSADGRRVFSHAELAGAMRGIEPEQRSLTYHWTRADGSVFAFSAESTERRYYFAPAFLTGWQPFPANQLWQPWYAVAHRMRYAWDHELFPGRMDVWQTGYQSWLNQRGDCEDHALLLADWLMNMGEDARVVLGDWRGEGHAWVVLIRDERVYLLEATQKFGRQALREYPLASMMAGYQPRAMFNRETLWVNEGSSLTTRYTDERWRKAGFFESYFN